MKKGSNLDRVSISFKKPGSTLIERSVNSLSGNFYLRNNTEYGLKPQTVWWKVFWYFHLYANGTQDNLKLKAVSNLR